jgi:hypothetical protein
MEDDTCINDVELDVASAMSKCGIPINLRVRSIVTAQTLAVEETFQTPHSRPSLVPGTVLALEPSHNEGIYRALPARSRVLSFAVTLLVPPKVPIVDTTARLELALVTDPYRVSGATTDATFSRIAIADRNVSTAPIASIPLTQSTKSAYNPMAEPGIQTTLTVLTPIVNALTVPTFLAEPRYPAVIFRSASGTFPPEIHILVTVSYEVSRTVE